MSAHDDVNPQDEAWTSNVYGMSRAVRPGPDAVSRVTAGVRRRRRARAAAATVGVAAVVAGVSVGAAGLPLDGSPQQTTPGSSFQPAGPSSEDEPCLESAMPITKGTPTKRTEADDSSVEEAFKLPWGEVLFRLVLERSELSEKAALAAIDRVYADSYHGPDMHHEHMAVNDGCGDGPGYVTIRLHDPEATPTVDPAAEAQLEQQLTDAAGVPVRLEKWTGPIERVSSDYYGYGRGQ